MFRRWAGVADALLGVAVFIIVLIGLIIAIMKGVEVGAALLAASLALLLALRPEKLLEALVTTLSDKATWFLVAMSALIALLAESYRRTGLIDELGRCILYGLRNVKLSMVVVPAVIGLLPVPGGALMSAPIVEALSGMVSLTAAGAVAVNVWFRHMLVLSYPISDSIILVSILSGIPVEVIVAGQLPISATLTALGYTALLMGAKAKKMADGPGRPRSLLMPALPLLTTLGVALAVRYALDPFLMPIGVAAGLATMAMAPGGPRALLASAKERRVYSIALASFAAMFMKHSLELSGAVSALTSAIPPGANSLLIASVLPFLLGFSAGIIHAALVVAISLLSGAGILSPLTVNIAYVTAFLGYLGSPTHLCFVYTAEYFGVPLSKPYRKLAPLILVSAPLSIALLLLINTFA